MNRRKKIFFISALCALGLCLAVTGCTLMRKPSAEQLRALDQPPAEVVAKIDKYLARSVAWYDKSEGEMLAQGRPLTPAELKMAARIGVANPEKVRIVVLEKFPMPEDPELRAEAENYGMGSFWEGGRTVGHSIVLKPSYEKPKVIFHELVHVAQVEKLGHEGFLRRYFIEMLVVGYFKAPLELEAYTRQEQIDGKTTAP